MTNRRNREPSNGRHIMLIAANLYSDMTSGDGDSRLKDFFGDVRYLKHVLETWEPTYFGRDQEIDDTMKLFITQVVALCEKSS